VRIELTIYLWAVVSVTKLHNWLFIVKQEEFEDTKGVIRICISKKNRQHNAKRTNNDLQNIHIKLKIE